MLKLYIKDFWRYRYLLQNLISRDFKLKYRRSVLGVAWSVLNPVMLFTGAPIHPTILLGIYPLITLYVFCLGIGLFLSMTYVFFRDIMHIWEVFCTALMYGSAIFYSLDQISGWLVYVIQLNPVYWYIESFRACVLYGTGLTLPMVLICGGCALISLAVGLGLFKHNQDKFVLYM